MQQGQITRQQGTSLQFFLGNSENGSMMVSPQTAPCPSLATEHVCVVQWLVAREDYHRLLKQVYMNGTYNDDPFETYIEYVNFRPYISNYALLDLCSIAPKVRPCCSSSCL